MGWKLVKNTIWVKMFELEFLLILKVKMPDCFWTKFAHFWHSVPAKACSLGASCYKSRWILHVHLIFGHSSQALHCGRSRGNQPFLFDNCGISFWKWMKYCFDRQKPNLRLCYSACWGRICLKSKESEKAHF